MMSLDRPEKEKQAWGKRLFSLYFDYYIFCDKRTGKGHILATSESRLQLAPMDDNLTRRLRGNDT